MRERRVGPFLYNFTPGLTHKLLEASSLCWNASMWAQVQAVSEGPTRCLPGSCPASAAQQGLNND